MNFKVNTDISVLYDYLPLLLPVIAIWLVMIGIAYFDLLKNKSERENVGLWALGIIGLGMFGPIAYMVMGRRSKACN